MRIERKIIDDIAIFELKGKFQIGNGVEELRSVLDSTINEGFKKIIFVMNDIPYVDSVGLGELVGSYTKILKKGGKLLICGLTNKVRELFSVTKLLTAFKVKDTLESAIEELREASDKEKDNF